MTEVIERDATVAPVKRDITPAQNPPKLLDQVRDHIRVLHYSRTTESTYTYWIKFYIHFHDLRHTVGSRLAESGASLRDIQVWLGHTSPVTSTRYTHVELARLRAVADLVGARNLRAKHRAKGEQQAPVTRETPREPIAK